MNDIRRLQHAIVDAFPDAYTTLSLIASDVPAGELRIRLDDDRLYVQWSEDLGFFVGIQNTRGGNRFRMARPPGLREATDLVAETLFSYRADARYAGKTTEKVAFRSSGAIRGNPWKSSVFRESDPIVTFGIPGIDHTSESP